MKGIILFDCHTTDNRDFIDLKISIDLIPGPVRVSFNNNLFKYSPISFALIHSGRLFFFQQNIAPCWPGVKARLMERYLKIMTSGRLRGPDQGELDSWLGERCQDLCGPINTLCFNSWCHLTYQRNISPKTQHEAGHLVKNSPFYLSLSFNLIRMFPRKEALRCPSILNV